jgi:hypothetical protein
VGPGEHADFARDRADFFRAAPVNPQTLVQNRRAQNIVLQIFKEGVKEFRLNGVGELLGISRFQVGFKGPDRIVTGEFLLDETGLFEQRRRF